jgi:hypothetical protein
MKQNKREIPQEFKPARQRDENSSIFGFTNDLTLVSYAPNKNKSVVLLSSLHHDSAICRNSGKPEIIEFYNKTKGAVQGTQYSEQLTDGQWQCFMA